jgi:hypothetical protein
MKTIASLTMIYLPSTFAASIFSTGFFSYDANGTEIVKINPQIWKMFAVGIGMSFVTIAVWVYLNKKGTPSIFNWARQRPVKITSDSLPTSTKIYVASGALGVTDTTVLKDKNSPDKGISVPKISLPVPIDGDIA